MCAEEEERRKWNMQKQHEAVTCVQYKGRVTLETLIKNFNFKKKKWFYFLFNDFKFVSFLR